MSRSLLAYRCPSRPARWLAGMVLACLAGLPLLASGDAARDVMGVTAAVLPRTALDVAAPAALTVTPTDRVAGRVREPLRIAALSNTREGLELSLQAPAGLFTAMRVRGPGIDARLSGEGGQLAWRWNARPAAGEPARLELQVEFELDPALAAGSYAWPLLVAGRALDQ